MQRFLCNGVMFAWVVQVLAQDAQTCDDASLIQSIRASGQGQQLTRRLMLARTSKNRRLDHVLHDHAKIKATDTTDYRSDAANHLKQSLGLSGGNTIKSRCGGLTQMSLDDIEGRWLKQHQTALFGARAKNQADLEHAEQSARSNFIGNLDGNRPVVVQAVVDQLGWPASTRWNGTQLAKRLGQQKLGVFTFDYPNWVMEADDPVAEETLGEYLDSNQSAHNMFLFASETSGHGRDDASKIVDIIRDDFTPHPKFAYPPESKLAIVAIDGIGSSHGFHSHDPVWQVQVEGYKMWYLLPPDAPTSQDNPNGGVEWGFAPLVGGKPFAHPNGCAMLAQFVPPPGTLTCLVAPGEMILVPNAWLHATCGLSNYTASAGGWMGLDTIEDEDDEGWEGVRTIEDGNGNVTIDAETSAENAH
eukprot:TRINITY_DN7311_c0_g3_i1.p1 TRINITY_DN7311_c0_g3~~TRINITY_DN7311_c0_g3_i1.p1  ORF type:complete len:416 (+),score=74.37 TRINITY_DN7311_c0_g3_i1:395-1642(+)